VKIDVENIEYDQKVTFLALN